MFRTTTLLGAVGLSAFSTIVLAIGCSQGDLGGGSGGSGGTGGSTGSGKSSSTGDPQLTTGTSMNSTGTMGACEPGAANLDGCACQPGTAPRDCYDGNPTMAGIGACTKGMQECKTVNMNEFMGGVWQPCIGSGKPGPEVCDGKADEDCDGVVDNGCGCINGTTQMCNLPSGGTGSQTCANGQWGPCGCLEGTTQMCITAEGNNGSQTCTMNQWSPCVGGTCGGPITAGQPCATNGVAIPTPPNTCGCADQGQNSKVQVIYCENNMWSCFPADDCAPAACKACLDQHCAAQQMSPDPVCQGQLTTATNWLENCGPDRTQYFNNLNQGCPNQEVSTLNQCKFSYCIMNGTCSFW